jgi:hypothetical protein
VRRAGALLGGWLALACGGWPPFSGLGDAPAPASAEEGIQLVDDPAVFEFYTRASAFYGRLARRRFDSIETYQDEALRDFFRDESAYADYYADLTGALVEAHFEKNRPVELEVLELRVEGPGRARVLARIHGADGRPLRPGRVHLDRDDRWERSDGVWRIEPSRR